jgi:hypothetical protein
MVRGSAINLSATLLLALVLDSMVKLHLLSHTALSQYGVIVDGRITILGAPAAHSANLFDSLALSRRFFVPGKL